MHATKDDLIRVADANPGVRVELDADGELLMSPPAGSESARRNGRLTRRICEWADDHPYVAFDSSAGFTLPDGSIRSPDASLVAVGMWDALSQSERETFARLVPDVAIELVSPSDRPSDLRAKLAAFRSFGTSFVALIDPYRNELWTDGAPPEDFTVDLTEFLT